MLLSKRALSKAYLSLPRDGQRELIRLEKEIDRYASGQKVKELAVKGKKEKMETSVLIEVKNLPAGIVERLRQLERQTGVRLFVRSHEEDVRENRL